MLYMSVIQEDFFLQVETITFLGSLAYIPTLLGAFAVLPLAVLAYCVTLVVLAGLAKQLIISKIEPSVHK